MSAGAPEGQVEGPGDGILGGTAEAHRPSGQGGEGAFEGGMHPRVPVEDAAAGMDRKGEVAGQVGEHPDEERQGEVGEFPAGLGFDRLPGGGPGGEQGEVTGEAGELPRGVRHGVEMEDGIGELGKSENPANLHSERVEVVVFDAMTLGAPDGAGGHPEGASGVGFEKGPEAAVTPEGSLGVECRGDGAGARDEEDAGLAARGAVKGGDGIADEEGAVEG